jgi:hypothetical protein
MSNKLQGIKEEFEKAKGIVGWNPRLSDPVSKALGESSDWWIDKLSGVLSELQKEQLFAQIEAIEYAKKEVKAELQGEATKLKNYIRLDTGAKIDMEVTEPMLVIPEKVVDNLFK